MNLLFTSFQPWHYCAVVMTYSVMDVFTVVPAMGGHPWEQAKVSVHDRWPLIRGTGWWGCTKHITPCTTALCSTTRDIHSEYKHWCIMHGIIRVSKINEITMYGMLYTVEPVLGDHPFCPAKAVSQDRWSLITGRTKVIVYRCTHSHVVSETHAGMALV